MYGLSDFKHEPSCLLVEAFVAGSKQNPNEDTSIA